MWKNVGVFGKLSYNVLGLKLGTLDKRNIIITVISSGISSTQSCEQRSINRLHMANKEAILKLQHNIIYMLDKYET